MSLGGSAFGPLRVRDYVAISIFWLGVSLHWSAFLSIVMQVRVAELVDPLRKGTALAALSAAGALISTLVELVAGPISDRCSSPWGRRRPFIFWGTLLSLPFILLFMGAPSFGVLVLSFVVVQLFLNWANGPYQAVIPDQVPPERHGLASASMALMQLLGTALGLALAGLLLGENPILLRGTPSSLRLLLLGGLLCLALLLTMLWTVLGMKEQPWRPRHPEEKRVRWAHLFDIRLREHPDFRLLILSRFCFNLAFYTVALFSEYYLRDAIGLKGRAPFYAFLLFETATLAGVVGAAIAGLVADRYSKKGVLYLCSLLLGMGGLVFLGLQEWRWVMALGAVFGATWGAFAAVDWALASNLVPVEEAGRYMAIWHIALTVPQVVAPLLAGPLADRFNAVEMGLGWRLVFGLLPLYLIPGVLFLRPVRERKMPKV